MFVLAYHEAVGAGWALAINSDYIQSVRLGQDADDSWGYVIDTTIGTFMIDEKAMELLVGYNVASYLKKDLEILSR